MGAEPVARRSLVFQDLVVLIRLGLNMKTIEENTIDVTSERFFFISTKKLILILIITFVVTGTCFMVQADIANKVVLGGNESSHVALLDAIVDNGQFDSDYWRKYGGDASFYKGKYYSNKPPGYAFFLTPPYYLYLTAFGEHKPFSREGSIIETFYFMKYSNVLLSSLSIVILALFLSTFKLSTGSIAFGIIAATFGTVFPAYTVLTTSLPLSLFLCSSSILFFRLFRLSRGKVLFWTISVFAAVYALVVDYSNGFLLLPLLIFALLNTKMEKKFLFPALIGSLPGWLLLCYNYIVFDNPFVLTYSYYIIPKHVVWENVSSAMSFSMMPYGIYGLLFSPSRGLFLLSPVAILGVLAYRRIFKAHNSELKITAIMFISMILFISSYSHWHGGHSVGYRHILVAAVLLASFSAFFFEEIKRPLKAVAIVVLLVSCFTGLISFFIELDKELLGMTWKGCASRRTCKLLYGTALIVSTKILISIA